jgi:hypothetical protein
MAENTQGAPKSQHDIQHDEHGPTKMPNPKNIEQGTKPSELRDKGDKATNPKP